MSLNEGLQALEARKRSQGDPGGYKIPRALERYFHALDNARREMDGLEPLPDLPYTEEDYEDDLRTLREHIPAMRSDSGWQTDAGQALLDEWERETRERIEKHD